MSHFHTMLRVLAEDGSVKQVRLFGKDMAQPDKLRTLYVKRVVLNADEIITWAKAQGFPTTLLPGDLHVTQIYSKALSAWPQPDREPLTIPPQFGVRYVDQLGDDGAVVLHFESTELQQRWTELVASGARSSYPSYRPHVTITYDPGDVVLASVKPYLGRIALGPEMFAEIETTGPRWLDTITEKTDMPITEEQVIAFLKERDPKLAALVEKDMTAADAHVSTALGNDKKKPKTNTAQTFAQTLAAAQGTTEESEADDEAEKAWELPLTIIKSEPENMMIFGWASVSTQDGQLVVDKQGDVIYTVDLEAAAYDFVLYSRTQGDMHMKRGVGRLIEAMMFTKEKQDILKIDLGLEGFWVGFKVDDPALWEAHKRGERPEFSIGGRGVRIPA